MKRNFTALMAATMIASIVSTPVMANETAVPVVAVSHEAGNIDLTQEIMDTNLRTTVENYLKASGVTDMTTVSQSDLDKITSLSMPNQNISTLRGIELLRKLKELDCSGNSLTILEGIEKLKDLDLNNSPKTENGRKHLY